MANKTLYNDLPLTVGDTVSVNYKIIEGDKTRFQKFTGILLKIRGDRPSSKMLTVRKISKIGIGVERIIPLHSPFVESIAVEKRSGFKKSKLYFVRDLSERQVRYKLYRKTVS